jgi:acetolactate synthase-1/2/3 large subunit
VSDIDRLAEGMIAAGVERIFGIPGGGPSLTLIDRLAGKEIPFQLVHFEASAAIMAGVGARLGAGPGVAVSIKGPGLANMVPGLAACQLESLPMIAICEAYPPAAPISRAHKRMDHGGLVSAVSKGRRFLAEEGPGFEAMVAWAHDEVPAPVLLELAGEIAHEESCPSPPTVPWNERAVELVQRARRPIVIAGTLAVRQVWSGTLNQLTVPVFSTAAAKGVVDETLPHAAGIYTGVGLDYAPETALLPKADLVVGLGLRAAEVLRAAPFSCPAINIDIVANGVHAGFDFQIVSSNSEPVLAALRDAVWDDAVPAEAQMALRNRVLSARFAPAHVFDAILRHFGGRARLVLDTGYFCTIGEHVWLAQRADWCLGSGQGRYMGIATPMSIGAAMCDQTVPTILAVGDGGIGMFAAELRIAVARRLPLLVVLLSDGGFGSVRTRAIRDGLRQEALIVETSSWLAAMEGLGLPGSCSDDNGGISDALACWRPEDGPAFLQVNFDPETYQEMVVGVRA